MSNARDKANIPALNFSSTGIDDNATSTAVTIDSSENVGIGTTSPSRLLHLNTTGSGTNTYLQLTSDATGTGTLDGFQIIVAGSDGSTILTQRENSSLQFTTNNTERMRITSAGNVGIGTTSVSTKLQVTKASSGASGVLSAATVSLFENSGNTDIVIGAGNTSKSRIGFGDNGDAFNGRIDYDHSDRSMRFGTGGQAERMRIDSSGRVGIGTSSPSSLLHLSSNDPKIKLTDSDTGASHLLSGSSSVRNFDLVVDDGGSSGSPRFSVQIQNSGKFYILNSGNVGIGTATPTQKLDVSGTVKATAFQGDGSALTGVGGGITQADNWRITANFAGQGHITSNWERNDNLSSYIGSGMSESSGTFTFPATGIYLVNAQSYVDATSGVAQYMGIRIMACNDGVNFNAISQNYDSSSTDNFHGSMFCSALFDVTNTSNNKIRLYTDHSRSGASEVTYAGNTSINYTGLTFIRLGDT